MIAGEGNGIPLLNSNFCLENPLQEYWELKQTRRTTTSVQWRYPNVCGLYISYTQYQRQQQEYRSEYSFSRNARWEENRRRHVVVWGHFLQCMMLEFVRLRMIKLCLCSNWTVCVKQHTNLQLLQDCALSSVERSLVVPVLPAMKTEAWPKSPAVPFHKTRQ